MPLPAASRARADSGAVTLRGRFFPSALYSTDRGFGVGFGVGVANLGARGTDATLDLRLQQHFQSADLAAFSADPYAGPVHVAVTAGASRNERRRFEGVGPGSRPDDRIALQHRAAYAGVRLGAFPLGTTALYVQPSARLEADDSGGVAGGVGPGTLDGLDAPSRRTVAAAQGGARLGGSVALELATDLRDSPADPSRGLLAAVEHRQFRAFSGSGLSLARTTASVDGYVPVRGRTTVVLRAVGVVTRGGTKPIPFYDLATLDDRLGTPFRRDRLTGRDVLAVGAGLRTPVANFFGLYGIDLSVTGFLGNAYTDVLDQFSPAVSFDASPTVGADGRAPLLPAVSVGVRLVDLRRDRVSAGIQLGLAPGGLTVAGVRLAYDLRVARPTFR